MCASQFFIIVIFLRPDSGLLIDLESADLQNVFWDLENILLFAEWSLSSLQFVLDDLVVCGVLSEA